MAYMFKGAPLQLGQPFTDDNGNQYPGNWLEGASAADREALGISEQADYNKQHYNAAGVAKDLDECKAACKKQQKENAFERIEPTDWYVIRALEDSAKPMPTEIKGYRAAIHSCCNAREAAIDATTSIEELIAAMDSLPAWPVKVS